MMSYDNTATSNDIEQHKARFDGAYGQSIIPLQDRMSSTFLAKDRAEMGNGIFVKSAFRSDAENWDTHFGGT